jgi:hypothetical protein
MIETCGCCTGTEIVVPVSETNPPGRSALVYRVGTHATFLETMLARLGTLPQLTTRDPADPSIALLDAWAVIADVLTFYQERIANEGYLPTALERRSVLELAALIGYRLRPGVAASVRLAFTVANGFAGTIPAGTRAQSVPGAGESPQFFETSGALEARDVWNALAPRLTRPQIVTPPVIAAPPALPPVTGADVIDTVYLDGIATGLRPGNALIFVFGSGPGGQYLRIARAVDVQADQKRTEVTLAPERRYANQMLELFLAKAQYLFPGSDIAARVVQILTVTIANRAQNIAPAIRTSLLRGVLPQIALLQDIAGARGFTRIATFLNELTGALQGEINNPSPFVQQTSGGAALLTALPGDLAQSPLTRLDAIVGRLALTPSRQPSSALHLSRSIGHSFAPQSDLAPRLIAAFNPAAAGTLYQAWSAVATPRNRVQVLAPRVKATLFAANYAGPATVTKTIASNGNTQTESLRTAFNDPPTIASAWTSLGTVATPLASVALDAQYDQVAPGSWVAIDRPTVDANGALAPDRITSYHVVTAARAVSMDTANGLAAKVTVVSLDPPWLSGADAETQRFALAGTVILRGTIVYAQTEPLALAEEPLDTDIGGDSIDLRDVYDGLEPGRWIVVSGMRTDIAGVTGVAASELAMIAGVSQGSQAPLCALFILARPPFAKIHYTTAADANGDRVVVGELDDTLHAVPAPPLPAVLNQQYCDQVELAPGFYANVYVPTAEERDGTFPSFAGILVDPVTNVPYPDARIRQNETGKRRIGAFRISGEKLHTVLALASPLAYTYDRTTVTIYGNVVTATHGQRTGELLGNGDASRAFASFTLGQRPLTYVSAPTASGTSSTLTVRVNDLEWHEAGDLGRAGLLDRVYVTREDDAHKTTLTFGNGVHGARTPTGTANLKAAYRYGLGKEGNVAAWKISQLATHPLGVQEVVNPLAASGGAGADTIEQARTNAPAAVMALDRLVSVRDYADFARAYAGIGKAHAARMSDGRRQLVYVTIAGAGDIPIDPGSDLYGNLLLSLQTFGDPYLPVALGVRRVRLLVMSAAVGLLPDYAWDAVAPKVRAALLALFGFDARDLGRTAFLSEAVRAVHGVDGVAYVNFTTFDGVPENISATQLAALGATLAPRQYVRAEPARIDMTAPPGSAGRILPAEVVFLTPDVPDTLILSEAGS